MSNLNLKTKTETYNFEEVTISTVVTIDKKFETLIYNKFECELYCKQTLIEKYARIYHKSAVTLAEDSILWYDTSRHEWRLTSHYILTKNCKIISGHARFVAATELGIKILTTGV